MKDNAFARFIKIPFGVCNKRKATVSITGAGYPLDCYVMERSFPIGVSNEFTEGSDCTVEVRSGLAVVMTVKK